MEQKQLNFNAPLLSVRRLSSTIASSEEPNKPKTGKNRPNRQHSLPIQKTDYELGEVTKPAAVPFQWEQIPGRAKGKTGPHHRPPEEPSTTPRLPPGRIPGVLNRVSGEVSGDRMSNGTHSDAAHFKEHAALLESLASGINETDESGADSGVDDAYADAHDTLSLLDSFTWECSVSGLSGYDGLDEEPPRGTFSADLKTREFIMSRFLPAAKAMVLEMPQYVSRKQNAGAELPPARPAKKFYSGELRPLRDQYGSNPILSFNKPVVRDLESDDEDDGCDDNDHVRKKPGKACGFFPRLCVKNSLFLLNPVPGLKSRESVPVVKSRAHVGPPVGPAGDVRRMARTAYSGPLPKTRDKAYSGPLPQTRDKPTSDPIYRKSSQLVAKTRNLLEAENKLIISKPNESLNFNDSFRTDLPQGRPRGGRISPYRNEAPKSPFHDGARFLGVPKKFENLEGLDANNFGSLIKACDNFLAVSSQKIPKGSGPVGPVAEKTLYIDSNVKSTDVMAGRITLDQEVHHTDSGDRTMNLQVKNEDVIRKGGEDSFESSLPPLLPKSPSESWLWRTLPSISLRNPFSPTNTRKQGHKSPKAAGAKWETIVKTSNVHHDHVRYSEELVPHLSPHSKT